MTAPTHLNKTELARAVDLIHRADRFALATHVKPDPDAIGSISALGRALEQLGKEVVMLCDDLPPDDLLMLIPGSDRIVDHLPDGYQPDLFIGLDASDPERLGKVSEPLLAAGQPVIVIDHHITNLMFGDINLVGSGYAATAELLIDLIDALDAQIDRDIATALTSALIGDTLAFATSSVTPYTMQVAARLMESGANLHDLIKRQSNQRPFDQIRLWSIGLRSVQLEDQVIWAVVPYQERSEVGLTDTKTNLASFLLSAQEAQIAAVFREGEDGSIECSFRSELGWDVAAVALSLGGGGHAQAAGCTIDGSLPAAVERVIPLLKQQALAGIQSG
ncbi:MAG: hypothetical protein GYB68_12460 [Chloroflexi bacterium]|nr:hypothetical protein [Chloroflexota bacterium]